MSLKALARQVIERNAACNTARNSASNGPETAQPDMQHGAAGVARLDADFEERAAIAEFDGGMSRAHAEVFAALGVIPIPTELTRTTWRAALDDAGRFLDAKTKGRP